MLKNPLDIDGGKLMYSRGPVFILLTMVCLSFAILSLTCHDAEARTVYDYDLSIDSDTIMFGDTFEVRGNVTVNAPATLTLSNAVLELVGDANGSRTLRLAPGASLVGDQSTVRGNPWTIALELNGSTDLDDCILESVWGVNGSYGVLVGGASNWNSVMVRQSPNGTGVKVTGVLVATLCIFEDLGDTLVLVSEPTVAGTTTFTGCEFGPPAGTTGTSGILYQMPSTATLAMGLVVTDSTFEGLEVGIQAQVNTTIASVTVTGTSFDGCGMGVSVQGNKATVSVTYCVADGLSGPAGFHFYSISSTETALSLTAHHLVVNLFTKGIYIQGPVHGFLPVLHHVNVTNCDQGISSMGSTVRVEDSNVTDCTWCFYAETRGRIEVRRTVHEHGSGRNAPGEQAAVVAFTMVNVTSCKWRDGIALTSGSLSLMGEDGMELERVDLAHPEPKEVVAWSVTRYNRLGRLWIIPTISVDGEEFEAANFSIYNTSPQRAEVVDHLPPDISSVWPGEGLWFASSEVTVRGNVVDRGSGLHQLVVRIVGGQEVVAEVTPDGNWTVVFDPVVDGTVVVELNATDVTGGFATFTISEIHVDTMLPAIVLYNETLLVNEVEVPISGTTEPISVVHVKAIGIPPDHPFTCEDNITTNDTGRFFLVFILPDGRWDIAITSTDRAGNVDNATFEARVDTLAPTIMFDLPDAGEWYNSSVRVSGQVTDEGVSTGLWAWFGEVVLDISKDNGWFEFYLTAAQTPEGEVTITIRALDEAGNEAEESVTVHIDRTPPVLTVDTPADLRFFTAELKIDLEGRLQENNLGVFTMNGYPMDLLEDIFTDSLVINEGENVFTLYARDMAGNEAEVVIVILKDLTAPTYTLSTTIPGGEVLDIGGENWCTFNGSGNPQVVFTFEVSEWSRVTGVGGIGTVEGEGSLVLVLDLEEGPNSFAFNIDDEADNRGETAHYAVTVDTTPPELTVEGPKEGIVRTGTTASWAGWRWVRP